jgi:hypothetical protein
VDEVIIKFKGKVIFQHNSLKKHEVFGIKKYKLCDRFSYTYNMSVYFGKQINLANIDVTFTHGTLLKLVWKVDGVGHDVLWTITLAHRSF